MLYALKTARSAVLSVMNVPVTPITCIYSLGISANENLPQRSVILMACHSDIDPPNKRNTNAEASNSGGGSNNDHTNRRPQQRRRQQQQHTGSRSADVMTSAKIMLSGNQMTRGGKDLHFRNVRTVHCLK
jgi:hypothetical protein